MIAPPNPPHRLDPDSPEFETAIAWAARLSLDGMSKQDQQDLKDWLGTSPARLLAFEEALDILGDENVAEATRAVMAHLDPAAAPRTDRSRRHQHQPSLHQTIANWLTHKPFAACAGTAGLASALAGAAFFVVTWANTHTPQPAASQTPNMYVALATPVSASLLPDGSQISLNKHTALGTTFTTDQRSIALSHGEAIFDVMPDRERPFVVSAPQVDVRVRGTVFNIDAWGQGVRVEVQEGRVELMRPGTQFAYLTLDAGTGATVDPRGQAETFSFNIDNFASWQDDWIIAQAMSLTEVVAKLDRHHTGTVRIASDTACEHSLFGRFRLSQTRNSLEQIAAVCDLQVTADGEDYVLSLRGSSAKDR